MKITLDVPVTIHCIKEIDLDISQYFNMTNGELDLDEDSVSQFVLEELQNNGEDSDFEDRFYWEHNFDSAQWPECDDEIDINVEISDEEYKEWDNYEHN